MSAVAKLAAGVNGVAKQQKSIFDLLDDPRVKTGISAVAGKFLTAERMLTLSINAVKKNPRLGECDPRTVLGAIMLSSSLGLEPNTPLQQAFLIPYAKSVKQGDKWVKEYECQFQIGYQGYITLMYRSPTILSVTAEAVHENDLFKNMQGSKSFLEFEKKLKDRGDLIGAFSYVKLVDNGESAFVLPLDEILKIRDKSETYKSLLSGVEAAKTQKDKDYAQKKLDETPWVMWIDDMAAKSAIKKHRKKLPLGNGDALTAASEIEDSSEAGRLNLSEMCSPDAVREVINTGDTSTYSINPKTGELEDDFIDKQSGVISEGKDPQEEFPIHAYPEVREALTKAKTKEDLSVAAKMINGVQDPLQQAELDEFSKNRQIELHG